MNQMPDNLDVKLGDLSRLMNPRAVAVIGASEDFSRIGGQPMKLLTEFGYQGKVYPVNPKYKDIKGLVCYRDATAVPKPCDLAVIALSAARVADAIEQCGAAGIPFAIVLSSGFGETGNEGKKLQERLRAAAHASNVRIIGPNCLGILNLKDNVRSAFAGTAQMRTLIPGPFAMVTQSGGFGFGVVAAAAYYGVGFNYAVSTGNEVDISLLDLAEYFLELEEIEAVVTFMEGVADGRRLAALGQRALQLGKPILAWKVGNSKVGRQAAESHTARMTADYELFKTVFRHGGFIEVYDIDDLIDALKAFRMRRLPRGNRVAVISTSGGSGVILADRCIENGLDLPRLTQETTAKARELVVDFASVVNPIDATAHGYNDGFASYNKLIETVLADPNIDQAIIRAPRGAAAATWSKGLIEIRDRTDKPILVNWPTSPDDNADVMQFLEQNLVPCILAPSRGVKALAALTEFARKKQVYDERPRSPWTRVLPKQEFELRRSNGALTERESKTFLAAYGIPTVKEVLIRPDDFGQLQTLPFPFPVAVKIESSEITHKTEAGCVRLNVATPNALENAISEVVAAAARFNKSATINGVVVQEMKNGFEVIVGAVRDKVFGPVILFGLGGVNTELMRDVTYRLAPFGIASAKEMINEIRGSALLQGFRGQPPCDIEALAEVLSRVSLLMADHMDKILEIDINPLFVHARGAGVTVADALFVLG